MSVKKRDDAQEERWSSLEVRRHGPRVYGVVANRRECFSNCLNCPEKLSIAGTESFGDLTSLPRKTDTKSRDWPRLEKRPARMAVRMK